MEAKWFGNEAANGLEDSDASASSGVHDSASSMSPVHSRKRRAAAAAANGNARRASGSLSGSDPYSSKASSSAGRHSAHNGHSGEARANAGEAAAPAMPRVPELEQAGFSGRGEEDGGAANGGGGGGLLGTWANRQTRFDDKPRAKPSKPSLPAHIPGTPQEAERPPATLALANPSNGKRGRGRTEGKAGGSGGAANGAAERMGECEVAPEGPGGVMAESGEGDEDEAAVRQAAWRWRFNRRWVQEQARQLDPEYGLQAGDEDGWDEALGYLDACGPGWHLQIARTTSEEFNLSSSSLVSTGSGLSTVLLGDSARNERPLAGRSERPPGELGEATKGIVQVARKAADLYQQQQAIEQLVTQRWDSASNGGWPVQQLPAVQIDKFGRFPFVLAKAGDRLGAKKLLVRGRNGATEAQLVNGILKEVLGACAKQRLPPADVSVLGSGTMEWCRERDRLINVMAGKVVPGGDRSIQSRADVARLAAALTRASLPMQHRVVTADALPNVIA
ncbi:hypothetical protein WJX81_001473 [Elliptochloris bilobata]|uniref:Uncharacterized protein n=1 Tax=Elliptochloris bilobata TaxID=381761 RepID=A0AAW1SAF2_9CHLO